MYRLMYSHAHAVCNEFSTVGSRGTAAAAPELSSAKREGLGNNEGSEQLYWKQVLVWARGREIPSTNLSAGVIIMDQRVALLSKVLARPPSTLQGRQIRAGLGGSRGDAN